MVLQIERSEHVDLATALPRLANCAVRTAALLARGQVHQPRDRVGICLRFADGSSSVIYRETVLDRPAPLEPCMLVVQFRLRYVRGRGHALFRAESLLNTPLFVGFPGFVSKLWLAADEYGRYRGCYEWDGAASAESYVRTLWWPLALVSHRLSIRHQVLAGCHRDEVLDDPGRVSTMDGAGRWWLPSEPW
jgi:hypothetical protein